MTTVLLVWPSFVGTNAAGVRGRAFARGISLAGARVVVVAPPDAGAADGAAWTYSSADDLPKGAPDARPRGRWEFLPAPLRREMRDAGRPGFDALRAVRERVNPDVSIVSSPAALTLLQARRALHGGTGRFVIDVRDLAAESLAAAYGPKLRYRALRLAEGRAYRRADGVLAVTRRMREAIVRDYRVPPERVHLVPNGADVEQFRPHAGKVPKTTDVIFSGTLEGRRSDDLADAFVSLLRARPETRIAILGLRAGAEETEFGARLRSAGFFERIDARPPIPHAEVPRVLASARVGIVPQLDRPIFRMAVGAKFYEYLAAGIPVVAWGPAGDSELGELLAKHRCGFYASDARGFVDAVLRILNEPELEASLAKGALTASEIFDRSRVVQRAWEQVLRPLASGGL